MTQSPYLEKVNDVRYFEYARLEGSDALSLQSNIIDKVYSRANCRSRSVLLKSKSTSTYTLVSDDFYTKIAETVVDSWLSTDIPDEHYDVASDEVVHFAKKKIFSIKVNVDPSKLQKKPPRIVLSESDL